MRIPRSTLVDQALIFATEAHHGQFRKYTGEPYISHPIAVANMVGKFGGDSEMVAAALLHDTIEDCGVTREAIEAMFGEVVADLVVELTDVSRPEDGNRAARKAMDLAHAAKASAVAKTIKALDLADNTSSIVVHDRKFAKVYLAEKARVLGVLENASHPEAVRFARRVHSTAMSLMGRQKP